MAKPHERVFALVAAVLFLTTSVAFSGVVVWQIYKDNKDSKQTASLQKSAQKAVDDTKKKTDACSGSATGETKDVPETFKPENAVTELGVTDLKEGTGAVAKTGDCLQVKYNGTLASNGTQFDGNFDKPLVFGFVLGQGKVIKGWDQGMVGIKVGGLRRLVIPAALAYGAQAAGEKVPANSDLVFVVELVKIK